MILNLIIFYSDFNSRLKLNAYSYRQIIQLLSLYLDEKATVKN